MINFDNKQEITILTLDTHTLLWYVEGITLKPKEVNLIEDARKQNQLYISAISLWEIAMLSSKGKIVFSIALNEWVDQVLKIKGLNLIELSPAVLIESCQLPHFENKDPADRIIISASRSINSRLMTFDQRILDYSSKGYLKTVEIS
jgi:PIN domain nuclease of toxin-antitoxin system